jgi:hypothetical protein
MTASKLGGVSLPKPTMDDEEWYKNFRYVCTYAFMNNLSSINLSFVWMIIIMIECMYARCSTLSSVCTCMCIPWCTNFSLSSDCHDSLIVLIIVHIHTWFFFFKHWIKKIWKSDRTHIAIMND